MHLRARSLVVGRSLVTAPARGGGPPLPLFGVDGSRGVLDLDLAAEIGEALHEPFDLSLFAGMTLLITRTSKALGLPHDERMSLLFCGSQKSLASGVPIANVLFVGHATSMVILPLMIYHQLQLLLSTVIAQRSSKKLALAKNAA